jgi:hypothetical protein
MRLVLTALLRLGIAASIPANSQRRNQLRPS